MFSQSLGHKPCSVDGESNEPRVVGANLVSTEDDASRRAVLLHKYFETFDVSTVPRLDFNWKKIAALGGDKELDLSRTLAPIVDWIDAVCS